MLHSCWMADRVGPRPSDYRVPLRRDVKGAVRGLPGVLRGFGGDGQGHVPRRPRRPRLTVTPQAPTPNRLAGSVGP